MTFLIATVPHGSAAGASRHAGAATVPGHEDFSHLHGGCVGGRMVVPGGHPSANQPSVPAPDGTHIGNLDERPRNSVDLQTLVPTDDADQFGHDVRACLFDSLRWPKKQRLSDFNKHGNQPQYAAADAVPRTPHHPRSLQHHAAAQAVSHPGIPPAAPATVPTLPPALPASRQPICSISRTYAVSAVASPQPRQPHYERPECVPRPQYEALASLASPPPLPPRAEIAPDVPDGDCHLRGSEDGVADCDAEEVQTLSGDDPSDDDRWRFCDDCINTASFLLEVMEKSC